MAERNPIDRYYQDIEAKRTQPKHKWLVKPEWVPLDIQESAKEQRLLELHQLPRLWQLLEDFLAKMSATPIITQPPAWIDPTLKSKHFDLRTEDPVTLPAAGTEVLLLTITVPDRFAGNLVAFGHEIVDPAQIGNIHFAIRISGVPIQFYADFKQQIGQFNDPTDFPIKIKLKYRQRVEVVAFTTGGVDTQVFARLTGYTFPVADAELWKYESI